MAGSRFKTYAYPAEAGGGRAPPHGEGRFLVGHGHDDWSKIDLLQIMYLCTSRLEQSYICTCIPSHSADLFQLKTYFKLVSSCGSVWFYNVIHFDLFLLRKFPFKFFLFLVVFYYQDYLQSLTCLWEVTGQWDKTKLQRIFIPFMSIFFMIKL